MWESETYHAVLAANMPWVLTSCQAPKMARATLRDWCVGTGW